MKRYIFIIIAALFSAVACEGFLDRFPLSQESPESYFRNESQLAAFSNTLYQSLYDNSELYNTESDVAIRATMGDLLRGGNHRTAPASGGGWDFDVLRKVNTLLGHLHQCEDADARLKYEALARFFRVEIYAELVYRFGDVPWIDHELDSDDPLIYGGRDSREFVMQKMIDDIDFAIMYLPSEKSAYSITKWTALALKSRFCLFEGTFRKYHGITGYEHEAKWYLEQAAEASLAFMNSSPYTIYNTGNPESDYRNLFASLESETSEVILAVNYIDGLKYNEATNFCLSSSAGQSGLTKKIVDSYLCRDGSRFSDKVGWETMQFYEETTGRDPRLAQTIRIPGYMAIDGTTTEVPQFGATVTGFQHDKWRVSTKYQEGTKTYNDICVYRTAEVYLNYAEAMAELGTITQADINKSIKPLRDRAGMPNLYLDEANADPCDYMASKEYGYPNVDPGKNKGVILEIRRERTIELVREGNLRHWDLMRWKEGKAIEQAMYGMYFPGPGEYDLDNDKKADICLWTGTKPATSCAQVLQIGRAVKLSDGTSGYVDFHQETEHVFDEKRDYFYPITLDDLSLNPNLKQNPEWPTIGSEDN